MNSIKNICFVTLSIFIWSCSTKEKFTPAEDALDAVRFFKDAFQKGNQELAKAYCLDNTKNQAQIKLLFQRYNQLSFSEKKQLATAPIIILSNNNLNDSTVQIITTNQDKIVVDTFIVVQEKNIWRINLSK